MSELYQLQLQRLLEIGALLNPVLPVPVAPGFHRINAHCPLCGCDWIINASDGGTYCRDCAEPFYGGWRASENGTDGWV